MAVKPIPEGYHSITPYLVISGADKAIDFYKQAFRAEEIFRMPMPDGKIGHAELKIGNSMLMLSDECSEMGFRSAQSIGATPVSLLLYVEDVDDCFNRAIEAGAQQLRPLQDQFYGDRSGTLADPFGHVWTVATHIEDVAPEEMEQRLKSMEQHG